MHHKVSIIMSAYNRGDVIAKAVTSCLSQSYKNIELIIIDDCSTDNTNDVISYFAKKDNRIVLIKHSENLGAGAARKTGLNNASGDYICFVDSDDVISNEFVEILLNKIIEKNYDVVVSNWYWGTKKHKVDLLIKNKYLCTQYLNATMSKASIWKNFEYNERRLSEDFPSLIQLMYYSKSVAAIDYTGYFNSDNINGIINSCNGYYYIYFALSIIDVLNFFADKILSEDELLLVKGCKKRLFVTYMMNKSNKQFAKEIEELKNYLISNVKLNKMMKR